MLQHKKMLPVRMAEAIIESQVDVRDEDSVVRVLIESGFSVNDVLNASDDATRIARFKEAANDGQ